MLTPEEKKQLHEKWKLTKGARWTKIEVDKSKLGNADQKEPIWLMVNHEVIPDMTRSIPYTIIASRDEYGLDRLALRIDEFSEEEYELYVYANPQSTIYFLWNEE